MLTSDDKVGGWVKKGQNHDDVILEWSLIGLVVKEFWDSGASTVETLKLAKSMGT